METPLKNHSTKTEGTPLGGLYLTFRMGDENYGIEILKVQEIIQMMEVTSIPRTPKFVKGIINLRGKVIPVIDMRLKFGLTTRHDGDQNCIIVVDLGDIHMGVIIDSVSDVVSFPEENTDKVPSFGVTLDTSFIRGIGKVDETVTILLDIQSVLTHDELYRLSELADEKGSDADSEASEPDPKNGGERIGRKEMIAQGKPAAV